MKREHPARRAEDAMSDITMLYAIIYQCEGNLFRTHSARRTASSIVRQCKAAAGRALRELDKAREESGT